MTIDLTALIDALNPYFLIIELIVVLLVAFTIFRIIYRLLKRYLLKHVKTKKTNYQCFIIYRFIKFHIRYFINNLSSNNLLW